MSGSRRNKSKSSYRIQVDRGRLRVGHTLRVPGSGRDLRTRKSAKRARGATAENSTGKTVFVLPRLRRRRCDRRHRRGRRPCLRQDGRRSRALPFSRAFSNYFGERFCPTRQSAAAFLVGYRRRCSVGVASTTADAPPPPSLPRLRHHRSIPLMILLCERGGSPGVAVGRSHGGKDAGVRVGKGSDRATRRYFVFHFLLFVFDSTRRGGRPPPSWR